MNLKQEESEPGLGFEPQKFMLLFNTNIRSSEFLSKNLKIKIFKIIIFPVVLYVWETLSLTLREGCMLRVYKKKGYWGEYLGPRRMRMGSGEDSQCGTS